jgi:bacteriorhodopsin
MEETPTNLSDNFWGKFARLVILFATIICIIMCVNAVDVARREIEDGKVSISSVGILTLIADLDFDSKTIIGDITPTRRGHTMTLNKPEVPWLKAATIALVIAIVANLYLLYLIILRRESAKKKSKDVAIVVAIAGILFFAGSEMDSVASDLAIGILAYAAAIHFTCNGWPHLRAQLHKP